ncbi:MAG TPA: type II secretion system protein [Dehalococcoidia bacterium]|nr:type II secretion system protein [Dehalococcoidia bacterium]
MSGERGNTLVEAAVALALIGIIGVCFLSAVATSSSSRMIADEQTSGRILAESQMEELRKMSYALTYDPIPISDEYASYSAVVDIDPFRNGSIQKITVTITHRNKEVATLESYKVNR